MTTDTALGVTKMVVADKGLTTLLISNVISHATTIVNLEDIPYIVSVGDQDSYPS